MKPNILTKTVALVATAVALSAGAGCHKNPKIVEDEGYVVPEARPPLPKNHIKIGHDIVKKLFPKSTGDCNAEEYPEDLHISGFKSGLFRKILDQNRQKIFWVCELDPKGDEEMMRYKLVLTDPDGSSPQDVTHLVDPPYDPGYNVEKTLFPGQIATCEPVNVKGLNPQYRAVLKRLLTKNPGMQLFQCNIPYNNLQLLTLAKPDGTGAKDLTEKDINK